MKKYLLDTLGQKYPDAEYVYEPTTEAITWLANEVTSSQLISLEEEYDAQLYSRNRKLEYDALNQFELISDDAINSSTTHKDAVEAVKTKWPKDNSGPVE